jgi:hypothetical protein
MPAIIFPLPREIALPAYLRALAALFQARIFFSGRPVFDERALVLATSNS